jgi:hypothetical protein
MDQKGVADLRESALRAWRRTLAKDPNQAAQAISAVVRELHDCKQFSPWDITRFVSQMKNGVNCPGEFGAGKRA